MTRADIRALTDGALAEHVERIARDVRAFDRRTRADLMWEAAERLTWAGIERGES